MCACSCVCFGGGGGWEGNMSEILKLFSEELKKKVIKGLKRIKVILIFTDLTHNCKWWKKYDKQFHFPLSFTIMYIFVLLAENKYTVIWLLLHVWHHSGNIFVLNSYHSVHSILSYRCIAHVFSLHSLSEYHLHIPYHFQQKHKRLCVSNEPFCWYHFTVIAMSSFCDLINHMHM